MTVLDSPATAGILAEYNELKARYDRFMTSHSELGVKVGNVEGLIRDALDIGEDSIDLQELANCIGFEIEREFSVDVEVELTIKIKASNAEEAESIILDSLSFDNGYSDMIIDCDDISILHVDEF